MKRFFEDVNELAGAANRRRSVLRMGDRPNLRGPVALPRWFSSGATVFNA